MPVTAPVTATFALGSVAETPPTLPFAGAGGAVLVHDFASAKIASYSAPATPAMDVDRTVRVSLEANLTALGGGGTLVLTETFTDSAGQQQISKTIVTLNATGNSPIGSFCRRIPAGSTYQVKFTVVGATATATFNALTLIEVVPGP